MCDCSNPTIQKNAKKVPEKRREIPSKENFVPHPKKTVQIVHKSREKRVIPCNSESKESWKTWRAKLEWRMRHKRQPLRLDAVNGFLGDKIYHGLQ